MSEYQKLNAAWKRLSDAHAYYRAVATALVEAELQRLRALEPIEISQTAAAMIQAGFSAPRAARSSGAVTGLTDRVRRAAQRIKRGAVDQFLATTGLPVAQRRPITKVLCRLVENGEMRRTKPGVYAWR